MKKLLAILAIALFAAFISGVAGRSAEAAQQPGIQPGSDVAQYPGADNVTISTECMSDGHVRLRLGWTSYGFGPQFVDLSLSNNGFIFGTFVGLGPLSPYQNSFIWEGVLAGLQHYIRINTGTQFGWQPSQTYTFITPNCAYYPPPPGQCGTYPYYIPCPITPPPPQQCVGTPNFNNYQPGNCAPVGACQMATIAISPAPPAGCVWTTKGEGSSYVVGEPVTYCYWVNMPMWVHIVATLPGGGQVEVLPWIQDNGQGGCATYGSPNPANDPFYNQFLIAMAGFPQGQRIAYLYGGVVSPGALMDTTTFTVN